ncbi:hypothetical protein M5K25_006011 [Dendrobium thyrsiflorum]|uniref:Uncharacterized protein n=1 Tax=Dendrobium thyrsiflorum TaxID=117978 RepID=A0ABD0VBS8_DENTH
MPPSGLDKIMNCRGLLKVMGPMNSGGPHPKSTLYSGIPIQLATAISVAAKFPADLASRCISS